MTREEWSRRDQETLGCTDTLLTEETLHTDPASEQWWWLLPPRLQIPNSKTISAPAASRPTTKLQCGESQSPAARPRQSLIGHLVASNGLQPTREQHRDADYQQRWRFLKQTEFIVPIDRNLTCCTKPADLVRPDRTAATSITWTVCTSQRTTISNLDIFILTNKKPHKNWYRFFIKALII